MLASPWWLLLLIVVAGLLVGYVWVNRRRRASVMRFTNLALLERVAPRRPGRWRHVPVALVLVALTMLVVALSGPQGTDEVPRNRATVVLAIDTSLSMEATDVSPSRLRVAQDAAIRFADQLQPGINLGLVSFAASASTVVSPTRDRQAFKRAVGALQLNEATATGDAILAGLASIRSFGEQLGGPEGPPPARLILLTDGKQTVPSIDPSEGPRGAYQAADRAKREGVPISAISFGTVYGEVFIDGDRVEVPVADGEMNEIAGRSGGSFFPASSDTDLRSTYDALAEQVGYETEVVDRSKPWLIAATALLVAGLAVAFTLGQRLP